MTPPSTQAALPPTASRVLWHAGWLLMSGAGVFWLTCVGTSHGPDQIDVWPEPWSWLALGVATLGLLLFSSTWSWLYGYEHGAKAAASATPVTRQARIYTPGTEHHGRMRVVENRHTGARRVTWATNKAYAGTLEPGARGGFDVIDADGAALGWFASVAEATQEIERRSS